jgi:signal transduction histidine kinase/HAMP domain-containing protein
MVAFKFRTYLIIAFSLLSLAVISSAFMVFSRHVDQYGHEVISKYGETLARDLAFSAADHLIIQEYGQLSDLIAEFSQRPDLAHISIIGIDGRILNDSNKAFLGKEAKTIYPDILHSELLKISFDEEHRVMNVYAPIKVGNRSYGYTSVSVYLETHVKAHQQLKINGAIGGFLFWVVSLVCVIGISRIITKPVSQMLLTVNRIAGGDFSKPVEIKGPLEIQQFANAFNTMTKIIEERENRLRNILDAIPDAVFLADREMNVLWGNKKMKETSRHPLNAPCYTVFWDSEEQCPECPCQELFDKGTVIESTFTGPIAENNKQKHFEISAVPLFDTIGEVSGFVEIARDISSRIQAEEEKAMLMDQLLQAQKMESIGRLAGGIAHDFNNILSVVNGCAELCLMSMKKESPVRGKLETILSSGQRGARLTQQLLAFSRKQIIRPEVVDLNNEIDDTRKILGRLLGEDIKIDFFQDEKLWPVKTDHSQLEQVVLNLAINARDAMPEGGNLTIETANITLDQEYTKDHYITPGDYVMLAISDTGHGMSQETRDNIFEPFFTTKEKGKGTGLGLAMVYGIVKQNSGEILVYSEPDKGSTFKVYLPRTKEAIEEKKLGREEIENGVVQGTGTILLAEDDELVREITVSILSDLGYTVIDADNGEDALLLCSHFQGKVDLLLTDMVMPKMNGPELAEKMLEMSPATKVLFMSGYTENAIVKHGIVADGVNFIHKPLSQQALSQAVQKALA